MFLTSTDFSEGDGGRTWTAEEEEMPPVGEKAGLPGGVSLVTPRGGSQQRVLGYVRNDLRYAGTPTFLISAFIEPLNSPARDGTISCLASRVFVPGGHKKFRKRDVDQPFWTR